MKLAICIIAYNRPASLERVLSSVEKGYFNNDIVDLIISIDKSPVSEVETIAKRFDWPHGDKQVVTHTENLGLRRHVLECGGHISGYDGLIVLEDDVYVAPSFFNYAKECVAKYGDDDDIAGISLYNFPLNYHNLMPFIPVRSDSDVFLMRNAQSWGQVWMPRQWKRFMDWYAVNNDEFGEMPHLPISISRWPKSSWLKYHTRYCIEENKYFVYPYTALSTCFSDVGEHTGKSFTLFQAPLQGGDKRGFRLNPTVRYDAFFENETIPSLLGIDNDDICVDFYNEKQNREGRRYWLTTRREDFKIVRSFALQLKPYDNNITYGIDGQQLFLYDTETAELNRYPFFRESITEYLYGYRMSITKSVRQLIKTIKNKIAGR